MLHHYVPRHFILLISFLIIPYFSLFAQINKISSNPPYFWFNGGLGFSTLGLAYGFNVNLFLNKSLISARYLYNVELKESSFFRKYPPESQWELGLLYGRYIRSNIFMVTFSAGISMTGGTRRGNYIKNEYFMRIYEEKHASGEFGFPIESQIMYTPFSFIGIGFNVFANLNKHEPIGGILANIELGHFR